MPHAVKLTAHEKMLESAVNTANLYLLWGILWGVHVSSNSLPCLKIFPILVLALLSYEAQAPLTVWQASW
jgi:hypothetical protein